MVYANDDFPDLELEYDHSKILCGETNTENLVWFRSFIGCGRINEKEKTAVLFNYIVGVKRPTFF